MCRTLWMTSVPILQKSPKLSMEVSGSACNSFNWLSKHFCMKTCSSISLWPAGGSENLDHKYNRQYKRAWRDCQTGADPSNYLIYWRGNAQGWQQGRRFGKRRKVRPSRRGIGAFRQGWKAWEKDGQEEMRHPITARQEPGLRKSWKVLWRNQETKAPLWTPFMSCCPAEYGIRQCGGARSSCVSERPLVAAED